jgi:hypothetical protein
VVDQTTLWGAIGIAMNGKNVAAQVRCSLIKGTTIVGLEAMRTQEMQRYRRTEAPFRAVARPARLQFCVVRSTNRGLGVRATRMSVF